MNISYFRNSILALSIIFITACNSLSTSEVTEPQILPPENLYEDLFYDVQANEDIFPDSKTFVDAVPLYDVEEIRMKYADLEDKSTGGISAFLAENFNVPENNNAYRTDSSSISQHIKKLWTVLKRPADEEVSGTLIPLPNSYIVPGGRFREIYYWDSYFTMLGLQADGEVETIQNMVDNFSYLIDKFGFIPNGNRTYYLSRSQPPFYAKMVDVLAESKSDTIYPYYLKYLEKEYNFWMKGADKLSSENKAVNRVVRLEDGTVLNRYWDEKNTPRPESFREDVKTAKQAVYLFPDLKEEEVYRNLRAGAESGWDFSSRWLTADSTGTFKLSTIHTTDIIPVDLNSLLYHLENTIAKAYGLKGNSVKSQEYQKKAEVRKKAIWKYLWNKDREFYMDYNFRTKSNTSIVSLAGVYPLFFEIAKEEQAEKVADKIEEVFLKPGGVVTTPNNTGQQWDAPNGWAPLQWITITGLRNYGETALASEIKERWLNINQQVYKRTYKLLEKYNVEDLSRESGGGEYPTQDGFGWTNGVYQKLSRE